MKHLIFLLAFTIITLAAEAQKGGNSKAVKILYSRGEFRAAIAMFEAGELGTEAELSPVQVELLADAYRKTRAYRKAEQWYEKLVRINPEPELIFEYAQILQVNEKYQKAKQYFIQYDNNLDKDRSDTRGKIQAQACDDWMKYQYKGRVKILNEKKLNSENFEFSPVPFGKGVIFPSTKFLKVRSNQTKTLVFYSEISKEGKYKSKRPFSVELSSKAFKGALIVNKAQDEIYFTGITDRSPEEGQKNYLQIYQAKPSNFGFDQLTLLPFCIENTNTAHPAFGETENVLYFSSDREGGFGGMDLYKTSFENGAWTAPVNLGAEVNTAGDEVHPCYHNGKLYFSSNGHGSIGGLDIQRATLDAGGKWGMIENFGAPFNSNKDDFGVRFLSNNDKEGYFVSARDGGQGEDDIYKFEIKD